MVIRPYLHRSRPLFVQLRQFARKMARSRSEKDEALINYDEVLAAADKVGLGQGFDLSAWDRGIDIPVELTERLQIAETSVVDAALQAALAT